MSRATDNLLAAVEAIDPGGEPANDEASIDNGDLVPWIDALALTLAAGLRVGAAGLGTPTGEPEVMDADDLAVFLGVDRKTVYDYANRGDIPHRRLGKRLLFSRRHVLAWLGQEGPQAPGRRQPAVVPSQDARLRWS